jgi:hypothetical protein
MSENLERSLVRSQDLNVHRISGFESLLANESDFNQIIVQGEFCGLHAREK